MHYTCAGIVPLNGRILSKIDGIKPILKKIGDALKNSADPIVIQIAGGSASGKTTIAGIIRKKFAKQSVLLTQDNYYIGREYSEKNGFTFDQPQSIDLDKLGQDIVDLKNGKSIEEPIYSFLEDGGKRVGYKTVEPAKLIIVEGLFVLDDKLSECGGIKVFIRTNCHGRFIRRVIRDISRTCWEPNRILGYFLEVVDPMHQLYIDRQEHVADYIVINQYDPETEPDKAGCQQEKQIKVELSGPLGVKMLGSIGAEAISHTGQEDVYFSVSGKTEGELLRIRKEGTNLLFTYKAPQIDGDVRVKRKVEFPITPIEEGTIQASCKEKLKIFKSRDLFVWNSIVFSQDCIVVPGKKGRYFLEVRSDNLKKVKSLLAKLGLKESKILTASYFELLK